MNESKLRQEGKGWVKDGIITEAQLEQILARYPKKDPYFIIIVFAILLTALGFLTFIMSDWARVPHISRVVIVILIMLGLYGFGDRLFRNRSRLLGSSFIILGYIVFGAGMLLFIDSYNVQIYSAWPFFIWSVIGLVLYFIYDERVIFTTGFIVLTAGQIYSGLEFSSFHLLLFLTLLFGYAHFVYHQASLLFGYLFGAGFILQMIVLTMAESQQFYWPIVYFLILYLLGAMVPKPVLARSLRWISLLAIFLFGMYQSFILQEDFFSQDITLQTGFLVIWFVLTLAAVVIKFKQGKRFELADLILFVPVAYLPFSYILGLVSLFAFSLLTLLFGYHHGSNEETIVGTIAFLLSTFTVYIQYAWDVMNKSLFFLIGGIALFLIGFIMDKQRRKLLDDKKGGVEK